LHPVPLLQLQRHVVRAFFHEAALAAPESPEDEVVLLAVEAHGEVVAVRLEVEEDAGALIELPAEETETHGDLPAGEIGDLLRDGVREIRVRLHAVDELLVLRA